MLTSLLCTIKCHTSQLLIHKQLFLTLLLFSKNYEVLTKRPKYWTYGWWCLDLFLCLTFGLIAIVKHNISSNLKNRNYLSLPINLPLHPFTIYFQTESSIWNKEMNFASDFLYTKTKQNMKNCWLSFLYSSKERE